MELSSQREMSCTEVIKRGKGTQFKTFLYSTYFRNESFQLKSDREILEEKAREQAFFNLRVAIGFMITVTCMIIAFNFINAKLEECRAKVLVGHQ